MKKSVWSVMSAVLLLASSQALALVETQARLFTGIVGRDSIGAMVEKDTGRVLYFYSTMTHSFESLDRSCWYPIKYGKMRYGLALFELDVENADCGNNFPIDR